ncbi:MAG: class I SAM-dependent methyltransferase [Actinomycetota bacterium]
MTAAVPESRWSGYEVMAQHVLPAARHLLHRVGPPDDGRAHLVDVGSGTGTALPLAIDAGWAPLGLDRSPEQVRTGRRNGGAQLLADAMQIPLGDASVDAAISNFALIFAADPRAVLAEVRRCLRPHAPFAWSAWSPGGWPETWRSILARALDRRAVPFPVELGSATAAMSAMTDAGFVDVHVEPRAVRWCAPSAGHAVDLMTDAAGGLRLHRAELERTGHWPAVRALLIAEAHGRAVTTADGVAIDDHYLAVYGRAP